MAVQKKHKAKTVTGSDSKSNLLDRIATALERMAPAPSPVVPKKKSAANAWLWSGEEGHLRPVAEISRIPIELLCGINQVRDVLLANTRRFADGFPANNALLWGARGMGKSSLVKSVHAAANKDRKLPLELIEIHREDIETLPVLLEAIRATKRRWLLFCDDLSFDAEDASYKSLKTILEGGIEGRPRNAILYATSNRRHMMARSMIENERSTAINPSEAVEEKVSTSDRFGLWLGFHACSQKEYLTMVRAYVRHFNLSLDDSDLEHQALEWAAGRGARSGRVAWQFIQDLAGRMGAMLN